MPDDSVIRRIPSGLRPARLATCLGLALLGSACDVPFLGEDEKGGGPAGVDTTGKETYDFAQGKFLVTDRELDLAVEGPGLFILRIGDSLRYLRRPGRFTQDPEGFVRLEGTDARLQGIRLFSDKTPYPGLPSDSLASVGAGALVDLRWNSGDSAPGQATTRVRLSGRLDANGTALGSVVHSQAFLHHAEANDLLTTLRNKEGRALGLRAGDVLAFSATSDAAATVSDSLAVTAATTVADLANALQSFLRSVAVNAGLGTSVAPITAAQSQGLRGALTIWGNTAAIRDLRIATRRPTGDTVLAGALALPAAIPRGTVQFAAATGLLRAPALPADLLSEAYDARGMELGLQSGDEITLSGSIGGESVHSAAPHVYGAGAGGTTFTELLRALGLTFRLTGKDGASADGESASLNPAGSDDGIPDGAIVLRGAPGRAKSLKDILVRASDNNDTIPSPSLFNTNMNLTTLREATDPPTAACTVAVHDAAGKVHRLALRFQASAAPKTWEWTPSLVGGDSALARRQGLVGFGPDSIAIQLTLGGGFPQVEFEPGPGIARAVIEVAAGGAGDSTGLRLAPGVSSVSATSEDGFAAGALKMVTLASGGIVSGAYGNGKSRPLYRIALARFPERDSLGRAGGDLFRETAGSGKPAVTVGRDAAGGAIRTGSLEYVSEAERTRPCAGVAACPDAAP